MSYYDVITRFAVIEKRDGKSFYSPTVDTPRQWRYIDHSNQRFFYSFPEDKAKVTKRYAMPVRFADEQNETREFTPLQGTEARNMWITKAEIAKNRKERQEEIMLEQIQQLVKEKLEEGDRYSDEEFSEIMDGGKDLIFTFLNQAAKNSSADEHQVQTTLTTKSFPSNEVDEIFADLNAEFASEIRIGDDEEETKTEMEPESEDTASDSTYVWGDDEEKDTPQEMSSAEAEADQLATTNDSSDGKVDEIFADLNAEFGGDNENSIIVQVRKLVREKLEFETALLGDDLENQLDEIMGLPKEEIALFLAFIPASDGISQDKNKPLLWVESDLYWVELPPEIQVAASELGYNQMSWDENSGYPAESNKPWETLSPAQQQAAVNLGYTKEGWDMDKHFSPGDNDDEEEETKIETMGTEFKDTAPDSTYIWGDDDDEEN